MLPAFFLHLFPARGADIKSASTRYITGWRSNASQAQQPRRGSSKDPYLLSNVEKGYSQLDEIKVTTTIQTRDAEASGPGQTAGKLGRTAHAYVGSVWE